MNKIVKNTLYLYSRQLFTLFLSLYTSRLTLQVLGVTDFGIYAAVGGVTSFIAIITSSLSNSTQRYITFALGKNGIEELNRTYISSIEIHLGLSLLILILAETVGLFFLYSKMVIPEARMSIAFWVYQFSILTVIANISTAPHYAEIVAHENMNVLAVTSFVDSILKLLSVVVLLYISLDILLIYSLLAFIVQFVYRVMLVCYCKLRYEECHLKRYYDKKLCVSMLSLTSWNFVCNLGIMGFAQGTIILLNVFFGTIINAAYNISFQAYFGIRNFTSSFQLASNPQIIKSYSENRLEEMRELLMKVCKFSFYLIFVMSFPIIMNSELILSIWLKDVPDHAQNFFVLLLVFSFFEVMDYPLDIAAQATGKMKTYSIIVFISYTSILLLSYIAYQMGAIPEMIIYIAIVISFIGIIGRVIVLNATLKLSVKEFFRRSLLRPFAVTLFVCPIVIYIKIFWGNLSVIGSFLFFVYIFLYEIIVIYLMGLENHERNLVKVYMHNFLSIVKKLYK